MKSHLLILCLIFFSGIVGSNCLSQESYRAGVAKVKITNTEPLLMVNGRISQGVKNDIYARALVINDGKERLIFITYDLNCLDVATPLLRERLSQELDIKPEFVLLFATHNHSAPIQINRNNFAYGEWLADQLFNLVKEAISNEQDEVSLALRNGMGYFVVSVGNAPVDYEIQLLSVERHGSPIAFLFNHGVHPQQAAYNKIEPGHPGYAMDQIESEYPGVQAMYADAAGGNQFVTTRTAYREEMMNAMRISIDSLESRMESRARKVGDELASALIKTYKSPEYVRISGPISSTMELISLPLAPPISKEDALKLLAEVPDSVGFVEYPNEHRGTNWVRMLLRYYDEGIPFPKNSTDMVCSYDTYLIHKSDEELLSAYESSIHNVYPCIYNEVIVAKIGQMPIVGMQGEVCAPIGARIKDRFRLDIPIMVFGYMGEHNLYIPTRELVRLNAYQAQTIQIQYASPVGWSPDVEDVMVKEVIRMVEGIIHD